MASPGASTYDRVPYASLALPQTHPDRLAAIARIFRLSPPPVTSCRVLELGCASGGNLVPMAFNLPGSEFVGVDDSQHQVDQGVATVSALGLRNLRLVRASILDVDDEWGRFDYVICHGVFSWVERGVQDKILEIAARNLAPSGVAYVSYNTYPGWHLREMARDMMRYHAAQFADPQEQVQQARALLSFLATATTDSGPYGQFVAGEADRAARAADSYLFHEHLERTNLPLYFHQFVERAAEHGLQFLSEAAVSEMLTTHFPPQVAETLERISPDLVHLEQYMDFVRNRQFRQTLLCHAEQQPVRALAADALHGLQVSSPMRTEAPAPDLARGANVVFTSGTKRAEVSNPATKAAFAEVMERWPRAVDVDTLCALALDRAAPFLDDAPRDEVTRQMLEELFGAVVYGVLNLHTVPPPCVESVSERPRAHPVASFETHSGPLVTNAYHQVLDLDQLSLGILRLADGQRTRGEMLAALRDTLDQEVPDDLFETTLASLVRNALFVG